MQVFGIFNQCCPAEGRKRRSSVDSVTADAYTRPKMITIDLNQPVKKLLDPSGSLMNPVLYHEEILRRLHDSDLFIDPKVRYRLSQEVGTRTEIRIKDRNELAVRSGKRMAHVTCFLHDPGVGAYDVLVTEFLCEASYFWSRTVVENVDFKAVARVGEFLYVLIRILQDLNGLATCGQKDIHAECGVSTAAIGTAVVNNPHVILMVKALRYDANEVANPQIDEHQ